MKGDVAVVGVGKPTNVERRDGNVVRHCCWAVALWVGWGRGACQAASRGASCIPMQSSLVSPRVRKPARQFLSFFCSILCIHVFVQSSQIIIERIRNVVVCSVDASKSCLVICFGSVARNLDMGSWCCASTILDSSHSR